jgi:hypothetical protein
MTRKALTFRWPVGRVENPAIGIGRFWRPFLLFTYLMATVQVAGCYFTLVRPYINTSLYEDGKERLPFQTRILMMPLMRWAHHSEWAAGTASFLKHSRFWYLRPAEPEAIVQLWVNIASLLIAGWVAHRIYRAASAASSGPSGFLAPFVYPLFLLLCTVQYILHTIQNFRFIYDLPGMAFFAVGLYLIYFRKHPTLFMALFMVGTLNRETTLLLLPFYMLSAAVGDKRLTLPAGRFVWRRAFSPAVLGMVIPLCGLWVGWHFYIFHVFKHNVSEYYPRVSLNLYTLYHPRYWPQLLSAGGYILPFLLLFRRRIADPQLRVWIWALPVWLGFMFFWGILVETRVFGELIPYLTCVAVLVAEDRIANHVRSQIGDDNDVAISELAFETEVAEEAAA